MTVAITQEKPVYDVVIIGSQQTALAAALTAGRLGRSVLVFDSEPLNNNGNGSRDANQISEYGNTSSHDDLIAPARPLSRELVAHKCPSVSFCDESVIRLTPTSIAGRYTGFGVKDNRGGTIMGRKLILAGGLEDIFPMDIPGFNSNWSEHM